ncbi:MAG: hypothetical protein IT558_02390 [Alphaproteobacteria bacterium]|nr:hypothetical protein [Alphaproteobacteria bacterium]
MNIELGILKDGGIMMVSDRPLPHVVKRVEFYRDQRLLMLVYSNSDETELMHYEIPEAMVYPIEKSPNVIIYSLFPDEEPLGYKAPLIKVGDIY